MSEIFAGENVLIRDEAQEEFGIALMISYLRANLQKSIVLVFISVLLGSLVMSGTAHGAESSSSESIKVRSVHIGGMLDVHNEALLLETLRKSEKDGVSLFIVQLDSDAVAGADVKKIASALKDANLATAIWVGPASVVYSKALQPILDSSDFVGAAHKKLADKTGAKIVASSFREFIAQLDGKKVTRLGSNIILDTGCSIKDKDSQNCKDIKFEKGEKFHLTVFPRFEKLSPIANLGHALISPSFAVGLLVLGLCLLVFEFYAASVGVAGIAGILSLIMAIYGLGYLPTNWFAIAIVVLGVLAMVIDVQAGGIGLYTILGVVLIPLGTFFATSRTDNFGTSISGTFIILVMALLFMTGAIPSLIRTRFGTPTISREDFIGEQAIAEGDLNPDGNVKLRGASFKARTKDSTPIKDGESCQIIKVEGIVLEVEPLAGSVDDPIKTSDQSS